MKSLLSRNKDTSSTENLLKLIRGGKETDETAESGRETTVRPSLRSRLLPFRRQITIGIDLRYDRINLVKVHQVSDHQWILTDYQSVACEQPLSLEPDLFVQFIKPLLKRFCSLSRKEELWLVTAFSHLDIRTLEIPEAGRRDLDNTVFWSYQKHHPINGKEYIFDFQPVDDPSSAGEGKIEVVACSARKANIEKLRHLFSRAGFPLAGISLYPFAMQNLFTTDVIETKGNSVCCLYFGMVWSRIDIFLPEGRLAFSRTIRASQESMVEAIYAAVNDADVHAPAEVQGAAVVPSLARKQRHEEALPLAEAQRIFSALVQGTPPLAEVMAENGLALSEEDILTIMMPAVERLGWQVERTIETYQANPRRKPVKQIFVSGRMSSYPPLIEMLGEQLQHTVAAADLDPFSSRRLRLNNVSRPGTRPERNTLTPAVGTALSRTFSTPSFTFTHADKQKFFRARRLSFSLCIVMVLIAFLFLGGYGWQQYRIHQARTEIRRLEQSLARRIQENSGFFIDRSLIEAQVERIEAKRERLKAEAKRRLGLRVLQEVGIATPDNVRLTQLTLQMGPETPAEKKEGKRQKKSLVLEGFVRGNPLTFDSTLLVYMENLKARTIFEAPVVRKKVEGDFRSERVMRFTVQVDLG